MKRKEVLYPNIGLYLYGYAQRDQQFLRFLLSIEPVAKKQFGKGSSGYTEDELTAALMSLALKRDMNRICTSYGLKITDSRVGQAVNDIRAYCKLP